MLSTFNGNDVFTSRHNDNKWDWNVFLNYLITIVFTPMTYCVTWFLLKILRCQPNQSAGESFILFNVTLLPCSTNHLGSYDSFVCLIVCFYCRVVLLVSNAKHWFSTFFQIKCKKFHLLPSDTWWMYQHYNQLSDFPKTEKNVLFIFKMSSLSLDSFDWFQVLF